MWSSVAETSDYWGVDEAYDVWWHQDGVVRTDPTEDEWDKVDMPTEEVPIPGSDSDRLQFIQLDVGRDGRVWATDGEQLYWRGGIVGGQEISEDQWNHLGDRWELIESSPVSNVAHCTNGLVYVVTHDNSLRYRVEGSELNEFKGTGWATFTDVDNAA
jgi:hypothetical protein